MVSTTNLDIVFGAMTFGKEGTEGVRTSNLDTAYAILTAFLKHGHSDIDTSRFYAAGTSEEYLRLVMHTKVYPNVHGYIGLPKTNLNMESMREGLEDSLTALKAESVDLWYLHAPDRSMPLEETLKGVDKIVQRGQVKRWGVSNFMAWEVAAICEICEREGWVKPSVYQGVYNALHRTVENELLPCLRKYEISFYAFNPLAGGYLTDRYRRDTQDTDIETGSRFDPKRMHGQMYRARYWNAAFFDALDFLRPVVGKLGLRESECALRWMMHHSQLKRELGDKVIIGASSEIQLEMNMRDFEAEELPNEVLQALDKGWEVCRGITWKYFH
ncbi:Aldo/keto reductase [Melanomma pulvis-pyrius CBS 109.77]|uniref:Aldo/keto reductase n=1 Tax=Melanomma pulvis-pyrius CBS 109.77 TaxID=1314802 RepID=A0A6A6WPJ3_9PLEO|nr:Aldo/keto reductase [Melanomma pulvis-pyrius CBS 109.77]